MQSKTEAVYVYSLSQRLFHWINVISIIGLLAIGLIIFNAKTLGVSTDGKILLKTIHVIIGYVFSINLIWRILQGFFSTGFARWSKTLPFMKGYSNELNQLKAKKPFAGLNPLGKVMVALLIIASSTQMVSGLVLAGTDIYYPPFGSSFAEQISVDKNQPVKPYSKENVNSAAYKEMRAFRKPFIIAHVYTFYALLLLIPLHIFGVVRSEVTEKTSIVSSMFHGYKHLPKDND